MDGMDKFLAGMCVGSAFIAFLTISSWGDLRMIAEDGLERGYIIHHPNNGELTWNPDLKLEK